MGPRLVIVSTPSLAFSDRVVEAHEPVLVQTFRPELAVERVVGRRASLGREKSSVTPFMYAHRSRSRETNSLPWSARIANLTAEPVQHLDDIGRAEAEPRHHRRREPTVRVDHRQNAQLRSRGQLVMDKVHGPRFIRTRRRAAAFDPVAEHPEQRAEAPHVVRRPGVRANPSGRPWPSQRALSLVVKPSRMPVPLGLLIPFFSPTAQ